MMPRQLLHAAMILLVLPRLEVKAAQSKAPIAHTAWQPLCDLSKDAQKLYNKALKLTTDVEGYFSAGQKAIIQAQILAAKENTQEAMLAAVAITAAIKDNLNNKKPRRAVCLKAAARLTIRAAYLHGRLGEFFELLAAMRGSTNGDACLAKHDDGGDRDAAGTTEFYRNRCNLVPVDPQPQAGQPTTLSDAGFTGLSAQQGLTSTEQPTKSNTNCVLLSTTTTEKNGDGGIAEALPFAAGYLTASGGHSANSPGINLAALSTSDKQPGQKQRVRHYIELWAAYQDFTACERDFNTVFSTPTAAELNDSLAVKTAIKNQYLNMKGAYDETKDKNLIEPLLKDLFKDEDAAYPKKVGAEAEKQQIPEPATGKQEKTKLSDLNDIGELQQVQNFYTNLQVQNLKKKLKEAGEQLSKSKTAKSVTAVVEEACNKLDNEEKCNADKKCSWHKTVKDEEANCKYNETKAAGNGVPVTQT
uniref:Variant surface glycoprotein 1125.4702 n=1 Tax=Trypanosoma brucei TaxID=5691 RepID=A0A1J0RAK5_9TRYP|nr:variant surface glycoprotein 1125.4702 [Trypanosoma brucei]